MALQENSWVKGTERGQVYTFYSIKEDKEDRGS